MANFLPFSPSYLKYHLIALAKSNMHIEIEGMKRHNKFMGG